MKGWHPLGEEIVGVMRELGIKQNRKWELRDRRARVLGRDGRRCTCGHAVAVHEATRRFGGVGCRRRIVSRRGLRDGPASRLAPGR